MQPATCLTLSVLSETVQEESLSHVQRCNTSHLYHVAQQISAWQVGTCSTCNELYLKYTTLSLSCPMCRHGTARAGHSQRACSLGSGCLGDKRGLEAKPTANSSIASFGRVRCAARVSVGSSQAVLYRLAGEWACLAGASSKYVDVRCLRMACSSPVMQLL